MNLRLFCARGGILLLLAAPRLFGQSITNMVPPLGTTNDNIMIWGNGFVYTPSATRVVFWGNGANGVAGSNVQVLTSQQISVYVPRGAVTGPVGVYQPGGHTNYTSTDFLVVGTGPYVTDFSPTYGAVGNQITIDGVHFGGSPVVKFNGTQASGVATANNGTVIYVNVPSGASTGKISVTSNGQTINTANDFIFVGAGPYVASFSPPNGGANDPITIYGLHFTGATGVKFNGVTASFTTPTMDTQVSALVPDNAMSGPVTVTTPSGSDTSTACFYLAPFVTGFSPSNGPPGTVVTITGTSLTNASGVTFNGMPAAFNPPTNNTNLVAFVPPSATTGPIRITTPGGQSPPVGNFSILPLIAGFTPSAGNIGTNVIVSGYNLLGTTNVTFNGARATPLSVTNSQLTVLVPAGASTGPIAVFTTNGSAASGTNFFLPAQITGFNPTNSAPGTTVTISGNNFLQASSVTFNGAVTTFIPPANNTTLQATVPGAVITGPIAITTPAGTVNSGALIFYGPPSITGFAPTSGVPGNTVTITGTNFQNASVSFNGLPAGATSVLNNGGTIQTTVPPNATTGLITVAGPAGAAATATPFVLNYSNDLALTAAGFPDPVFGTSNLTYTISVTNKGPFDAPNLRVTDVLPNGVTLARATSSAGAFSTNGNILTCSLGTLSTTGLLSMELTAARNFDQLHHQRGLGRERLSGPGSNEQQQRGWDHGCSASAAAAAAPAALHRNLRSVAAHHRLASGADKLQPAIHRFAVHQRLGQRREPGAHDGHEQRRHRARIRSGKVLSLEAAIARRQRARARFRRLRGMAADGAPARRVRAGFLRALKSVCAAGTRLCAFAAFGATRPHERGCGVARRVICSTAHAACSAIRGSESPAALRSAGSAEVSPVFPSATQTLRSSPRRLARRMGVPANRCRKPASSSARRSSRPGVARSGRA